MKINKLYIYDAGDPSVGIFSQSWIVECPIDFENENNETIEFFRKHIIDLYKEFAESKITADFDFEINNKEFEIE